MLRNDGGLAVRRRLEQMRKLVARFLCALVNHFADSPVLLTVQRRTVRVKDSVLELFNRKRVETPGREGRLMRLEDAIGRCPPQLNLNRPPMMFLRKSGSDPPVGVVWLTKSNTLPSFMP